jgi:hypothetical protein
MSPRHEETVRLRPPDELLAICRLPREEDRPTRPAPFWVETIRKSLTPDPTGPYARADVFLLFVYLVLLATAVVLLVAR